MNDRLGGFDKTYKHMLLLVYLEMLLIPYVS